MRTFGTDIRQSLAEMIQNLGNVLLCHHGACVQHTSAHDRLTIAARGVRARLMPGRTAEYHSAIGKGIMTRIPVIVFLGLIAASTSVAQQVPGQALEALPAVTTAGQS